MIFGWQRKEQVCRYYKGMNRQEIVTCDEQKLSRGDQVQFQRFETIKKKHWSPTTVAAIVRDEIYIGTRIWGKTRCRYAYWP